MRHLVRPWVRGAIAATCVAFLALGEGVAAEDARLFVPYSLFRLPNGLTVILHEDHSIPLVSVNVWYHAGSARENPGRTGFAHLFEHLMFEGSAHVPEGAFDTWLEAAGASNNGSTTEDRTNYYQDLPSNALDLALFLESDRMGSLLEVMSPQQVDGQRDVVKNELRQGILNQPYGLIELELPPLLYPAGHPYSWPVIGSMDDLSAASHEDVVSFFRTYYAPGNASLVVAGDIDPAAARASVERWFGDVPAGKPVPPLEVPAFTLSVERRKTVEDRVQLPKIVLAWPTVRAFHPSDAALETLADVLARGKNSRLYRSLVHTLQIAQEVDAYQAGQAHGGYFAVEVLARPGHGLEEILAAVDRQIAALQAEGATERETLRAVNGIETRFLDSLEEVGGFGGKANRLNAYWVGAGNPDFFAEDLARYRALGPTDVQAASVRWLGPGRVLLGVVPAGSTGLGLGPAPTEQPGPAPPAQEVTP